jgi:hypothetical protein
MDYFLIAAGAYIVVMGGATSGSVTINMAVYNEQWTNINSPLQKSMIHQYTQYGLIVAVKSSSCHFDVSFYCGSEFPKAEFNAFASCYSIFGPRTAVYSDSTNLIAYTMYACKNIANGYIPTDAATAGLKIRGATTFAGTTVTVNNIGTLEGGAWYLTQTS